MRHSRILLLVAALAAAFAAPAAAQNKITLLNVSYDPTRELYQDINGAFAKSWQAKTGQAVTVNQSHGGSGKQARAVIDGLQADVVTLALAYDVDALSRIGKLIPADWQKRLPNNSTPYTSTIVLLVRKGNPKHVRDWDDLVRPGISVVTPNPKTSGGARWNYLAAWGYAKTEVGHRRQGAGLRREAVQERAGARLRRARRDDHLRSARHRRRADRVGERSAAGDGEAREGSVRDHRAVGRASWPSRPSPSSTRSWTSGAPGRRRRRISSSCTRAEGQEIAARHYYRPQQAAALAKYANTFPKVTLFTIDEVFGGWTKAQKAHFDDGGIFDRIYEPGS